MIDVITVVEDGVIMAVNGISFLMSPTSQSNGEVKMRLPDGIKLLDRDLAHRIFRMSKGAYMAYLRGERSR